MALFCAPLLAESTDAAPPVRTVQATLAPAYIIEGESELGVFGLVSSVVQVGDRLVLCDEMQHSLQVLNGKGAGLRLLGGPGEGPGDLMYPSDLFELNDQYVGVVSYSPSRLKVLHLERQREVELASTIPPGNLIGCEVMRDCNSLAALSVENRYRQRNLERTYSLLGFPIDDLLGGTDTLRAETRFRMNASTVTATLQGRSRSPSWSEPSFLTLTYVQNLWTTTPSRLFAVASFDRYEIHVWECDGTLAAVIEDPDYVAPTRTSEELRWLEEVYRGESPQLSRKEAAILGIWGQDDGSLWVLPSRGVFPNENRLQFDVYDRDTELAFKADVVFDVDLGRRMGVHPRRDLVYVHGRRVYVLTDTNTRFGDPDEPPRDPSLIAWDLPSEWLSQSEGRLR